MLRWRRETILDIYMLVLGAFLFLAPWLFGYGREVARADLWTSGVLLVATTLATVLAFAEMGDHDPRALGGRIALAPWLRARQGDGDHRLHRRGNRLPQRARAVAHPL